MLGSLALCERGVFDRAALRAAPVVRAGLGVADARAGGYAAAVADEVQRSYRHSGSQFRRFNPSEWFRLDAGSAKDDTAKFVCAKAGRALGDRLPEPVLPKAPSDAELHDIFMDCSALVSVLMSPVAQKRCFDIGFYLHARYLQQERFSAATSVSNRMKALGWWGWIGPKYGDYRPE